MQKITNANDLRETIRQLENRQAEEWIALKQQAHCISENLQPANITKRMLNDFLSASSAGKGVLDETLGLATGFVAKKAITTGSHNLLVHLLGGAVEKLVAGTVAKNADGIKTIMGIVLRKILGTLSKTEEER